ncbi:DUF429 domain-containing protein [Georgenia sp. MJ173]|uniref:DUF429 domain-containing protein n=1 Tax=Georgenia sunbinii TaxID=3117728 RepID=UPI002F2666AD
MTVHVGIDLAWSHRARTGLAVVDASGALIASGSVTADEEIDGWLAQHAVGMVNVAIDAPLIVTNPTGMRECERLIGRAFGRYDASCHASSLAVPYFNPPRAAVLAGRHGWVTDPLHRASVSAPGAVEVYPHAAMVGLFGLGRILQYKKGPAVARYEGFRQLLEHLASLEPLALAGHSRWQELMRLTAAATRPVDLNLIEDELDAIMCAYLAWLWHHEPGALQVYGDAASGYIIAPPPPVHAATPRPPAMNAGDGAGEREGIGSPASPTEIPADGMTGVHTDAAATTAPVLINVVGRPTGCGGSSNEAAWKENVSSAVAQHRFPAPTRLHVEFEFRLGTDQQGRNAPSLDDLLKSTIDALDQLLGLRPIAGRPQADDERIDRIIAAKRLVHEGEHPGATIVIWPRQPK